MTAWSAYEIRRQDINTPAEGVKPPKKKVVRKKV